MRPPTRTMPVDDTPVDVPQTRDRPVTVYVDFGSLESATAIPLHPLYQPGSSTPWQRPTHITTTRLELESLRKNVRDPAEAVLRWMSQLIQHNGAIALNDALDRCLRPGPDVTDLNYAALAREVNQTCDTSFSPKRIRNAIKHLRQNRHIPINSGQSKNQQETDFITRLKALHHRLADTHAQLVKCGPSVSRVLRRAVGHEVLGVVRSAAGRLIDCAFGEGIPDQVIPDSIYQHILALAQRMVTDNHASAIPAPANDLKAHLNRLMASLRRYDKSTEADADLVLTGACVVSCLIGPGSLFGLMARLNVLMVARPLLDSPTFIEQMLSLSDGAGRLIQDRTTQTDMAWVRLQPEDRRIPSPNRLRSYCLNNAATHILQRLYTGELAGSHWFTTAGSCFHTMRKHDRGFRLLKTTEAIMLCVLAELTGDHSASQDFFKRLGETKTLALLLDLARYDNSPQVNGLVRQHAESVYADISTQLLVLPA